MVEASTRPVVNYHVAAASQKGRSHATQPWETVKVLGAVCSRALSTLIQIELLVEPCDSSWQLLRRNLFSPHFDACLLRNNAMNISLLPEM